MSIMSPLNKTVDRRHSQPCPFLSKGGPDGLLGLTGAVNPQPSDPVVAAPTFQAFIRSGVAVLRVVYIGIPHDLFYFNDR